jgi:hypothetical protein
MHQKTFDLGRETERCERGKPALVLDEVEPDAMAMGDGVSMGEWWRRCFPWPSASPRSVGVSVGRLAARQTSCRVPRPPPLYIVLPQGSTNHVSVGRPRLGRERGSRSSRLGLCEINLTQSSSMNFACIIVIYDFGTYKNTLAIHASLVPWILRGFAQLY